MTTRRVRRLSATAIVAALFGIGTDHARPAEDRVSLVFPHVAVGGGFATAFTILNAGGTGLRGRLILADQQGLPLEVLLEEGAGAAVSSVDLELAPGGAAFLTAVRPGADDPKSGWARLEASGGLPGGVATFQYSAGGLLKSQAGVPAGEAVEYGTIPVDSDDAEERFLGVAVANPGVNDVYVSVRLLGENGMMAEQLDPPELNPLGPAKQMARFLHELLPGRSKFRGSLVLLARPGGKFSAVALQQNRGLYSAVPVLPYKADWTLVWSDEFDAPDGSGVDTSKWVAETGTGVNGWGNRELQYYTARPENARMESGALVITAMREPFRGSQYTSARLKTQGNFSTRYGRIEARIKIPRGQGLWPAFWMLGDDIAQAGWPSCGEIDIMENIGKEPSTVHGTIHGPGYSGSNAIGASRMLSGGQRYADDYHVFAVEWEPDVLRWYLDGSLYQTRTAADLPPGARWVFDHAFFMLLNVAVGGNWPGSPDSSTVFPQTMHVDYVRVYHGVRPR